MANDAFYESCLPILSDSSLEEEDKTDKIEELARKETDLTGKALENAVLDVLWRFRNNNNPSSPPVARHTIVRRNSPAPWQTSRSTTPIASSPLSSAASPAPQLGASPIRPPLMRMKSSTGSYYTSPRPSPRPALSTPLVSHSPSLNPYEMSEGSQTPDMYSDYGSESVDWLVGDDGGNSMPFGSPGEAAGIYRPGSEWLQTNAVEMGPYDILRSVLRDDKSDEEIEKVLEANNYDLSAAIVSLMDTSGQGSHLTAGPTDPDNIYLVGKTMTPSSRPQTPSGQSKSTVVCRYWLSTGQCLRADCKFSHDLSNHVCKYWLAGNCLAGDSCIFSHDPASLMSNFSLGGSGFSMTPPLDSVSPALQLQDYSTFPSLLGTTTTPASSGTESSSLRNLYSSQDPARATLPPEFVPSKPLSRPSSRHQSPAPKASSNLAVDDSEAFPTLGSAAGKSTKKHHGKRGHGHSHKDKENNQNSMADVVRMSPTPSQSPNMRRSLRGRSSYSCNRENSTAAQGIPAPQRIPWLETGDGANKAYMKARQEAIRHGGARNKFLQSAAQAWNRNDVRAAKALSLRGQSENDLMREAHREAARHLYEERNLSSANGDEIYIDLHGLHPAEAVSYLANALTSQRSASAIHRESSQYIYAIVGTGHHSKGGRDKVGKAIRAYLNECRYAFREFSAPGDRGGSGGILGIDAASGDLSAQGKADSESGVEDAGQAISQHGKVRILKAEDASKNDGL